MKKTITSMIIVILMVCIVLPPSIFAASNQDPLLSNVCQFTVDKQRIYVSELPSENTAIIQAKCKEILSYDEIYSESSNPAIATTEANGETFTVNAVSDGSVSVKLEATGYYPVQFDFAVGDDAPFGDADLPVIDPEDIDDTHIQELIDNLQVYAEQLKTIATYEIKALSAYQKYRIVTVKNIKQAYFSFNKVIVPNYTKFVYELKKIQVNNEDMQAYHDLYLLGSKLQLEGLTMMKNSLASNKIDMKKYNAANKKLNEGRKMVELYVMGMQLYAADLQSKALSDQ